MASPSSTEKSTKSTFTRAAQGLNDTEVYFAVGDFAAACLTAEKFGIIANGLASVLAVGGRLYESITGRKPEFMGHPVAPGFYAIVGRFGPDHGFHRHEWHPEIRTGFS